MNTRVLLFSTIVSASLGVGCSISDLKGYVASKNGDQSSTSDASANADANAGSVQLLQPSVPPSFDIPEFLRIQLIDSQSNRRIAL